MRRLKQLVGASLVCWASMVASAEAAFIGLATPLGGVTAGVEAVTLTVSFDPVDSGATNLVGHEFYVHFVGLAPVSGSFALGSVYGGLTEFDWETFEGDYSAFDGVCGGSCPYPEDDSESPAHYQSVVYLFSPATAAGPGSLFSLSFTPLLGASNWALNVFGESFGLGHALYWEPDPWDFVPIPFAVLPDGSQYTAGAAAVLVAADITRLGGTDPDPDPDPGTPVPEPSLLLLLLGSGLLASARRTR